MLIEHAILFHSSSILSMHSLGCNVAYINKQQDKIKIIELVFFILPPLSHPYIHDMHRLKKKTHSSYFLFFYPINTFMTYIDERKKKTYLWHGSFFLSLYPFFTFITCILVAYDNCSFITWIFLLFLFPFIPLIHS